MLGKSPSIQAYDDGPIAQVPQNGCISSGCDAAADDYIVFDDSGWPHDDTSNALGLTTVTFGVDDGRIFAAYTEIKRPRRRSCSGALPPARTTCRRSSRTKRALFRALARDRDDVDHVRVLPPGAINLTPDDEDGSARSTPQARSPETRAATDARVPCGLSERKMTRLASPHLRS